MPVDSLHGPPGLVPQCRVPKTELRPLMSSRMSISPEVGQRDAGAQRRAEHPERRPVAGARWRCSRWAAGSRTASRTTPPAGAPKVAAWVSIRPEVQPARGSVPECSACSTRCPSPSWKTLAVLLVIVSISPVPKLLPGPVSYFQVPVSQAGAGRAVEVVAPGEGEARPAAAATAALAMPLPPSAMKPVTAMVPTTTAAADRPAFRRSPVRQRPGSATDSGRGSPRPIRACVTSNLPR